MVTRGTGITARTTAVTARRAGGARTRAVTAAVTAPRIRESTTTVPTSPSRPRSSSTPSRPSPTTKRWRRGSSTTAAVKIPPRARRGIITIRTTSPPWTTWMTARTRCSGRHPSRTRGCTRSFMTATPSMREATKMPRVMAKTAKSSTSNNLLTPRAPAAPPGIVPAPPPSEMPPPPAPAPIRRVDTTTSKSPTYAMSWKRSVPPGAERGRSGARAARFTCSCRASRRARDTRGEVIVGCPSAGYGRNSDGEVCSAVPMRRTPRGNGTNWNKSCTTPWNPSLAAGGTTVPAVETG
mmetsp:Transcript_33886/g.101117  ORF Transcript_33886/g.101117 Transcript_33886/m.101117 type:complete len:295 (-) Transcript_33886:747-1631(-)